MSYTPAVVPTDLQGTSTGILWTAANILANDPKSTDALAEAITQARHPGPAIRASTHQMLEQVATSRAAARWTMHAALPATAPRHLWATWQHAAKNGAFDLWPTLADLAARYQGESDNLIGLTPGHHTH
ncbi:hypothetical protein [Rhodococcus sp. 1168]|uniref:hypothetical protein n=1 Tax=Rhodococcus sp. 1168 TaxID=2018041 RepID=UPI000F735998|nr:hypothetical protein [Rhodococcus sp. 1168]